MRYAASCLFALLLSLPVTAVWSASITLATETFTDTAYPDAEPAYSYNFDDPVYADIVTADPLAYVPGYENRYFMSVFGPRYKQVSTSNVGFFDFHQGADITANVEYGGVIYDEDSNPPDIISACAGVVDRINDGPDAELELTGSGRWVRVRCNAVFNANPGWGNIYLAYRHLASIDPAIDTEGAGVAQGQRIGEMGQSGLTTTTHLHFSVRRDTGAGFVNVHPARVFDPTAMPHLLDYLSAVEIEQMTYNDSSARFRLLVPYNQASIRAVTLALADASYSRTYDFEEVSANAGELRDNNDYVDGLELYAYAFNRGHSAYRRYLQKIDELPASYPASPLHPALGFRPLLNEGILQTPAYVLDVTAHDLPAGYDINQLSIEVIDIWGHGVRAFGDSSQNPATRVTFSLLDISEDDAEEHEDGSVDVTSVDLEMVYDSGSTGDQTIGLRFRDAVIAQGVTVTRAFAQFSADEADSGPTDLLIRAEDSDSAAAFSAAANNISTRPLTAASVSWSPPAWPLVNEVSLDQQTPDLSALVQEVVDRPGWSESSTLALIISGTGKRVADSGDNVYYRAPYFYAEYTSTAANQPPVAAFNYTCAGLGCSFDASGSSDPDGGIVNYAWDLGDGNSASGITASHSYAAAGSYNVVLSVTDDSGATDDATTAVSVSAPGGGTAAGNDVGTPEGSVSGSYLDTHYQDDVYQALSETQSSGKPSKRYDTLAHIWQFEPEDGQHVFHVNAYRSDAAGDADSGFHFEWSGSTAGPWTRMLSVTNTADDDSYQSHDLGSGVSGTVYVRAVDNDSSRGNFTYSILYVDHMYIDGDAPPGEPPGPDSMQVTSITLTTVGAGKGRKTGRAVVVVHDGQGIPVPGATVEGGFSGSYNEPASGTTGADGSVTLDTAGSAKGGVAFTFCVSAVNHAVLSYNAPPGGDCQSL